MSKIPDRQGNYDAQDAFETQKIPKHELKKILSQKQRTRDIISQVYNALEQKGYNPVNQLTGYILSGDPTYITSYMDARKIIARVPRDMLLEDIINFYLFDSDEQN